VNPFITPENLSSREDFNPVFIEQARLYVLASKWCIYPLCNLVLVKLHETLEDFKLYETGLNSIFELIRFVYKETPQNDGVELGGIRNLVTRYAVSVLGQIGGNKCFGEILAQGGPFVNDFWNIVWGTNGNATT
jgi:hypothetical protein